MKSVHASQALFIKLGERGKWEAECVGNGTLRFGYRDVENDICVAGDWAAVEHAVAGFCDDPGSITRHVNQVRHFYEAEESVLWITFHSDRLWWCFAHKGVEALLPENDKIKKSISGWSDCSIDGKPLLKSTLSGRLLAVQGYQGTICTVSELDYLLHKINGTVEPHVATAQAAYEALRCALVPIIKKLHPKDLETLTDLIFRQSGWQRVGVSGGTEKDIDLDLISPMSGERIAIQVKSRASLPVWLNYREKYTDMRGYSRFYFVTHSPDARIRAEAKVSGDTSFILWDMEILAAQAVRGGLTGWLLDKAA